MRVKKHKHTRRAIGFYKIHYGFHEPFKVLLDGNFIHATTSSNLKDLDNHISRLLGCKCKLYVTRCVTQELKGLGSEFKEAATASHKLDLHKCGHENKAEPAHECLTEVIGKDNGGHWWVATQDKALRQSLGKIPGTPIIFATVNGLHLETPSEMARSTAKEVEDDSMALPKHERESAALKDLEQLRPKLSMSKMTRMALPTAMSARSGECALKDLEQLRPKLTTNVRFRRNFAKTESGAAKKKKRKRSKGGGGGGGGGDGSGTSGGGD
eukprot:gene343-1718_t